MIRRPPRSTLFPYTNALPISRSDSARRGEWARILRSGADRGCAARSEEHTSELQSRGHLVCRVLREEKKRLAITPLGLGRLKAPRDLGHSVPPRLVAPLCDLR